MSSHLSSLLIKDLSDCYYVRPQAGSVPSPIERNWSFIDHLSRARPTGNIIDLLESIPSESLIRHCSAELVFDMLKVIIKWLEVSVRERNRQLETPQTNNPICCRDLVPSERDTCTIASRANNFVSKKNLRQLEPRRGQTGFP